MTGPLEDLRIVDCSRSHAGLRAGGLLADYGADVVWVEPPGGAELRRTDPVASAVFNRGKRSIELDPEPPTDRDILERLLGRADVLLGTNPPTEDDTISPDYSHFRSQFPSLVHCVITGFGLDGRIEMWLITRLWCMPSLARWENRPAIAMDQYTKGCPSQRLGRLISQSSGSSQRSTVVIKTDTVVWSTLRCSMARSLILRCYGVTTTARRGLACQLRGGIDW
jgi:CoA-transferase family III